MKIVHVNLAKGFRGGERQTQLLIQGLASDGLKEQILVCRSDSPLQNELRNTPGLIFQPANHIFAGHRHIMSPSLIHAHDGKAAHWAFIHYLLHRIPYIITRRVPNPLKNILSTKVVYRKAAGLIAISSAIQDYLHSYVPGRKVRVIPSAWTNWAVDSDRVLALRQEYARSFVIGHVGALMDRHKGQRHLIEAARYFYDRYPQIRFIFLGSGPDRDMLGHMAGKCNNVEFLGFQKNVGSYLAIMDLFVFPSNYEGLGSTILDAMGFEVPVIASAVGGIPDIITHGKNGYLISPGDPQAIIQAIEHLYHNPDLRQRLASEAKSQLAAYSPAEMTKRYRELYHSVAAKQ